MKRINLAITGCMGRMGQQIIKSANSENNFAVQKVRLYEQLGESELMVLEYFNLLKKDPAQKHFVMSNIQKFMDNDGIKSDKNYQLVKKSLLPFVKNENHSADFTEILVWLFMQNHQFKMALIQAKALDKRLKSDGERVYELGEAFLDKEYYDLAIEAYEYVINKGKQNFLYVDANINKLFALTKKLDLEGGDISELDHLYQLLVTDLGAVSNTVILLSNFAHFKACVSKKTHSKNTLQLSHASL